MLRASFQNFVWFTPGDLTAAIHAKVPLFHGSLPEAGNQIEAVTSALQQALAARNLGATVASSIVEPGAGHPDRIVAFAAVKHPVVVGPVDLAGISPEMQPAMQQQIAALAGRPYNEGLAGVTTVEALLAPYREAGYVGATIAGFSRTPTDASDRTQVAISGKVEAGEIYRVSALTYPGTPVLSVADFASAAKLRPGDIASGKALRETLAPVEQAYRNQGYLDVLAVADPTLDPATHHVAYTVSVTPGDQYHLRSVHALNLDPAAQADFNRGWLMQPGDLYSPGYVATFLKSNTALRALATYTASFKASADPQTHLVDLTITFVRGGNHP
jgi:outer membrane protein insertion porin family